MLLVAAIAFLIYLPGLPGGFFFDDEPNILHEPRIRIETLDGESLHDASISGRAGPSGRPVAQLSFALNYYFSGLNPVAFKATNLAIHLLCGALLFILAHQLLRGVPAQNKNRWLPVWASAVWLLHPIQLLPVLHAVQRMTSLSALFLFAALILHIRGRELGGRAGTARIALAWLALWPLSFFSKETGVLFPFFVLAWEELLWRPTKGSRDSFSQALACLMGLATLAGLIYGLSTAGLWLSGYQFRSFTVGERLLTEGRVLWFYLGLIIAPQIERFGIHHDDIITSTSLLEPWTTLPALLGLAGLVWLAWKWRQRAPLLSFGIAWFFIGHGLESTFLPLEIAHEHRNYVPLFGIILAATALLTRAQDLVGKPRTAALMLATTALIYFPFVTALRAHQLGNELRRTQIEAQHHRNSARAQYEAGRVLASFPDATQPRSPAYSFARRHFQLAAKLDANHKLSALGLIYLDCRAGIPITPELLDDLAQRLRETPYGPADNSVMFATKELAISGEPCLARNEVERLFSAAHANPTAPLHVQARLHSWLADYLTLREHDIPTATEELKKALAIEPRNASNRLKHAQLLLISGDMPGARQLLIELRGEYLPSDERKTLDGLLSELVRIEPTP